MTCNKAFLAACFLIYGRFLERKMWNSYVYVADRLNKLKGSEQLYLTILRPFRHFTYVRTMSGSPGDVSENPVT